MSELICYVNGKFRPLSEATISARDLAVLRGYGVFDFLRTYHGRPFKLRQHLLRLERSAQAIYLDLPYPIEEIEAIVYETLQRNNLPEANIRIIVTGGPAVDSITPASNSGLLVLVTPVHTYPAAYYEQGVKVITVEIDRYLPQAKTINYIPAIMALKQAKAAGAVEALYVNQAGHILEGTTTNFFIFQGRQLITPQEDILPGVTRDVVLSLAQDQFKIVERTITLADLSQADEAFITASNKELMPVHHVNDVTIGNGIAPGPKTDQLLKSFWKLTRGG